MPRPVTKTIIAGLFLIAAILACNINAPAASNVSAVATSAALTVTALANIPGGGSPASDPPAPTLPALPSETDTSIPAPSTPSASPFPSQTSAASGNALVASSAICYLGPGKVYEVSSSISAGTRVDLLGRSTLDGWWIIRNPRYHDPCWIQAAYLQVDSNVDTSSLQIYLIPPTPTP